MDGDLHLTLLWWPEGALLVAHVLGAVEDDGVLLFECYRRHDCLRESVGVGMRRRRAVGRSCWQRREGQFIQGYMF